MVALAFVALPSPATAIRMDSFNLRQILFAHSAQPVADLTALSKTGEYTIRAQANATYDYYNF